MPAFIPYLLESFACSGILFCFYRIAYYNRQHHQFNRLFLLGIIIISLLVPFIKIPIAVADYETTGTVIPLLNVNTVTKTEVEGMVTAPQQIFDTAMLLTIAYVLVSCVFLFLLARGLFRIFMIYNSCPKERIDNIKTVMTYEKNAPFSFFRTIFWNRKIDFNSEIGERIFEHEKAHVHHLHSIDRLLINCVLTLFWFNPVYWLIKKEMIVVHEFIADRKSVRNNPETFSEMLLMSVYPGATFGVTSSFFNSSIKRRLTMLTKINSSKTRHVGKWMLLPVMLIVLAGFTLRKEQVIDSPDATFTVVIDAGHGGSRAGTTASDGTMEKDLNLKIAKKIRDLNRDERIKVVMTRETDEDPSPTDRVKKANMLKADAFISIHVNNNPTGESGIQIMMTKHQTPYAIKSHQLGSILSQELAKVYKIDGALRKGRTDDPGKGVWVLDAPEINYPSILIECGNMQNQDDLEFVKSEANQEKLAQHILNAVKQYAGNKTTYKPKLAGVQILVEKGRIDFELKDDNVINLDFTELKQVSVRNLFAGEEYSSDGSEIVMVDGKYLSGNLSGKKNLAIRENQKLIVVSTTIRDPWETLSN